MDDICNTVSFMDTWNGLVLYNGRIHSHTSGHRYSGDDNPADPGKKSRRLTKSCNPKTLIKNSKDNIYHAKR